MTNNWTVPSRCPPRKRKDENKLLQYSKLLSTAICHIGVHVGFQRFNDATSMNPSHRSPVLYQVAIRVTDVSSCLFHLQGVMQALLGSTKGVSSAARRFRLRCLKAVILLLDSHPELDFELDAGGEAADATAMLSPEEKRQQVTLGFKWTPAAAWAPAREGRWIRQMPAEHTCLRCSGPIQAHAWLTWLIAQCPCSWWQVWWARLCWRARR